jgi:hypothetical protein
VFLDDGFCGAAAVEIDPDNGCNTYSQSSRLLNEDEWDEDDELDEEWEEEEVDFEEEEDDDLWVDEDDF